jgi:hypothetical protein
MRRLGQDKQDAACFRAHPAVIRDSAMLHAAQHTTIQQHITGSCVSAAGLGHTPRKFMHAKAELQNSPARRDSTRSSVESIDRIGIAQATA